MNHRSHTRSSSHGRKLAQNHSRPPKTPPLHRRGHSYSHAPAQSQHVGQNSRPTLGGTRRVVKEVTSQTEDSSDDMAGFLQFCATCEKQIVTPGNSILYCSESCRRRDLSMPTPPMQASRSSNSSYFDAPPADIVPQRSPTVLRPASFTFFDAGPQYRDSHINGEDSETVRYYARLDITGYGSKSTPHQRPRLNRASTGSEYFLPSLTNTPSSSLGTAASWSSYQALPPKHDPSTGHFPTKSIDLVIPTFPTTAPSSPTQLMNELSLKSSASTVTSFRVAEAEDVSYKGRRTSWSNGDQTTASLKQLLSQGAKRLRIDRH